MDSNTYDLLQRNLELDEGVRYDPYVDTTGNLTIGIGHNLNAEGLCVAAVQVQYEYDILTKAFMPLDRYLPWWRDQPEDVQRVLANLMFNMGPGGLLSFKNTLKHIQNGRYAQAADGLLASRYAKQVGQRANRLANILRAVV